MKNILTAILIFMAFSLFAQQGELRLNLGLPYFNHLTLKPSPDISVNKFGFIGESIGLEYAYSDKQFMSFNFSFVGVAKGLLPFEREGAYTTQYSSFFSLMHHHQKNRLTYGYGVNYSINTWAEGFRSLENPMTNTRNQITNSVIGLTLQGHYKIKKSFNIGLIYRPTYFRLNKDINHEYEHLVSIQLLWRIKLKTFSKNTK